MADEKNTSEAVGADGWVRTGDIGEVDECGRFRVIDRVKVWPTLVLPFI